MHICNAGSCCAADADTCDVALAPAGVNSDVGAVADDGKIGDGTEPDDVVSKGVAVNKCVGNIAGNFDGGPMTLARLAASVVTDETGSDGTVGIITSILFFLCAVDTMTVS